MPWELDGEYPYPWPDEESFSMVFGHVGDFRVEVAPMIFNDRILVTHRDHYGLFHVAGFCYDRGPAAALAAMLWLDRWDELDVPPGFKKEAFNDLPLYGKGVRA